MCVLLLVACTAALLKTVPPAPMQLTRVLSLAYSSWTWDAFQLFEVSQGHPLSTLGYYCA